MIIEQTINIINQLPENKAEEISDFADFLIKKYRDQELTQEIQHAVSESISFDFLRTEEDLYAESDLKEKYHD